VHRRHPARAAGTTMKLYQFLFDQLYEHNVRHIFGIPGDFVLNLYNALQEDPRFALITLGHEPAVGFAADGAARVTNGLGACLITYGAGGLNMLNSVACAYAEESPLIVISGGPSKLEKTSGLLVHHEVKSFESQLRVYQEVAEFAAVIEDPHTAAADIRRAIDVALKFKRPVYLEIPRDMVLTDIDVPASFEEIELKIDGQAVTSAAAEIIQHLGRASLPVLIVGVEVHRFGLRESVVKLAERLRLPVTSSFLGRGVFPTRHPQFIGTYLGAVSPRPMRQVVEGSDCLLLLGERLSDVSLGVSADLLRGHELITVTARDVFVGDRHYENTSIEHLVERLLAAPALPVAAEPIRAIGTDVSPEIFDPFKQDEAIKVRHVINLINEFVKDHSEMPLIADTGDALFSAVDIRANECIAPAYYGTMGFSVPAALGVQIASGRRPLVLLGDGAFQMTGSEISRAAKYGCNPILVLLNNTRWEMLQAFFPQARYNDTVSWPFARLADLWGGHGIRAFTPRQFRDALNDAYAEKRFTIIEVGLQRGDVSPILRGFVDAFKARVYRDAGARP
jgi:indolepyruvate decarboxylase